MTHTASTHNLNNFILVISVVLIPLTIWPTFWDYSLTPKWFVLQILCLLSFAAWLYAAPSSIQMPSIGLPALAYVSMGFLSTFYATDTTSALLANAKCLTGFLVFFIVANHLTAQGLHHLLIATTLTGFIISILGILEFLGWQLITFPSSGRPSATLGFRNIAAMYLIQNLPLSVALFLKSKKNAAIWLTTLAITAMICFLIYTRTRGAWLGITVSAIFTITIYFWIHKKQPNIKHNSKKIAIGLMIAVTFGMALLPSGLKKQGPQSIDEKKTSVTTALLSITQEGGDRNRTTVWNHTLNLIKDHFLLGVGKNNWSVIYPQYDGGAHITFRDAPERPHNDFLQVFSELGIVGLIFFLWFCICVFRMAWEQMQSPALDTQVIAAACLTSFLAILGHSLFSFPQERITPTFFFWLIPGILSAQHSKRIELATRFKKPILVLLFVVSIVQSTFIWQYIHFDQHMYRARQAEYQNNWEQVAQETENARNRGLFHVEAIHLGGYAHNTLGQFKKSLALYQTTEHQRPYDVQVLNGHAIAAQNLGQFQKAETYFKRAIKIISPLPDVFYNLAWLYLQTQRPQQAAEAYQQVLESEAPSLDIYHRIALAHLLNKNKAEATQAFQNALKLEHNLMQHAQYIEQFYQLHRLSQIAISSYQILIEKTLNPPPEILSRIQQLQKTP